MPSPAATCATALSAAGRPGCRPREVLDAWFAFGEDAQVLDAGDGGWRSGTELADFADHPVSGEDRDWRALDPRLDEPLDEDEP